MSLMLRELCRKAGKLNAPREEQLALLPGAPKVRVSMTKQDFKDDTDINKLLARAQREGTLSHISRFEGEYADFSDVDDLLTAHERYQRGVEIFQELPSEVRREFSQDPAEFFRFVNNPDNRERYKELLVKLSAPGRFFPDVRPSTPPNALKNAPPGDVPAPVVKPPPAVSSSSSDAPPAAPSAPVPST